MDSLIELLAVAEAGSIAAAAARSGVTRSTLSRRLSAFEEEVGAQLLHRNSRNLRLTHAGEILVERARRIVEEAESAWNAVRALEDAPAGTLRVSLPPTDLFEELLVGFAVTYPQVRVLVQASHRHIDLIKENIDVALRFGTVTDEALIVRRVATTRCSLVASPGYLAENGRPSSPRDLASHRCIVHHGQSSTPSVTWSLRGGGRMAVTPHFACEGPTASLRAAVAGLGIALVPDGLTASHRDRGTLAFVLEDEVGMDLSGQLVYVERRYLLPAVRAFIDYTTTFYADHEARQRDMDLRAASVHSLE